MTDSNSVVSVRFSIANSASRSLARVTSPFRAVKPGLRLTAKASRLTAALNAAATGARMGFRQILASLHETRRQQARRELHRYRDLICDADTSISLFGISSPTKKRK